MHSLQLTTLTRTLFLCVATSSASATLVTQLDFLGKHPDAVLQPTTLGTTLHTLEIAAGDVYMGYGDFNVNTGPITMRFFSSQTDTFSPALISANTEAIHRIKVIGGDVWATTTDPLGSSNGGYISGPVGGGAWSAVNSLQSLHLFDIASYGGNPNHLFLSGSGGPTSTANSIVYESSNGGATWNTSLDLAPPNGAPTFAFTRFYGIGELNSRLYVQHSLLGQGFVPLDMYSFDGITWTSQPAPTTPGGQAIQFIDPDSVGGRVVVRDDHSGVSARPTYLFDGNSLTEIVVQGQNGQLSYWDHYVSGSTLYLLTNEQTVISTDDFISWQVVAAGLPGTLRSLAVSGNSLYFGASDASLYRTVVPEPAGWQLLLAVAVGCTLLHPRSVPRLLYFLFGPNFGENS